MSHRMMIIDSPPGDKRPRYRGTGFCVKPGGMTKIEAPAGHTWGFDRGVLTSRAGAWLTWFGGHFKHHDRACKN